jgi:hypothetical protein
MAENAYCEILLHVAIKMFISKLRESPSCLSIYKQIKFVVYCSIWLSKHVMSFIEEDENGGLGISMHQSVHQSLDQRFASQPTPYFQEMPEGQPWNMHIADSSNSYDLPYYSFNLQDPECSNSESFNQVTESLGWYSG